MIRRRSKYRAVRTSCGLHEHASKKEAKVCVDLQLMQKGGVIHELEFQPRYDLFAHGVNGEATYICEYVADFRYKDLDAPVVLDVKGVKTPVYRLKKKLMKACYGIEITET